jgi:hypothetical protein
MIIVIGKLKKASEYSSNVLKGRKNSGNYLKRCLQMSLTPPTALPFNLTNIIIFLGAFTPLYLPHDVIVNNSVL